LEEEDDEKHLFARVVASGYYPHAQPQLRRVGPPAPLGSNGRRIALVVGNDDYKTLPKLVNAARDARAIGAALKQVGFEAPIVLINTTWAALERALAKFVENIHPGDVALVFYSWHSAQIGNDNYLSPVDLAAADEFDQRKEALERARFWRGWRVTAQLCRS
jgi:Caspase domain